MKREGKEQIEILGIIPARGDSKGIPLKNIVPLHGVPLIAYTIIAAGQSRLMTRTILSSDSEKIIQVARDYGLEVPFKRPGKLSEDQTPTLPVIMHAIDWLEKNENYMPDYIVLLQPTSPLRRGQHIDEAVERLINSDADSIVSVVPVPHQFTPYAIMQKKQNILTPFLKYDEINNIRQKKPRFYARNGAAVYAFTHECLKRKRSIFGDKILAYEMEKSDSIDIDDELDLLLCEALLDRSIKEGNPPSSGGY